MNITYLYTLFFSVWLIFFFFSFFQVFIFTFHKQGVNVESRIIFPNKFLKICEDLQSGQQRHFGSIMEALIRWMFTMTRHPRERRAGHSKFHLSDLLLTIVVSFGDANPFSLTRHFNGCQAPGTKPKNSLISLLVIPNTLWIFIGILLDCKKNWFYFFYIWKDTWLEE